MSTTAGHRSAPRQHWIDQRSGRRVGLNSLWLILSRGGSQLLSFLFILLVARMLGDRGLGQFAFIAALVLLGNVVTTFGMDTLLVRELARLRHFDTPLLSAALLLQLGLAALFTGAVLVVAPLLPNQTASTLPALRLASLSLLPMAFSTTYNAALRAFERMELLLMATLIPVLGQVVAAMILLRQGAGLLGIAWAMIGSQVGAALLAGCLARRYLPGFRHHWTLSAHQYRQMLRAGGLLALLMAVAVIYQRIPILGLSLWATDEQTGWFAAAAKLVEAAKIVPYAYFGALFPALVRHRSQPVGAGAPLHPAPAVGLSPEKDASSAGRPSSRPFTLLLLGALLLALAASAMAGPAVATVYGRGYEPAVPVLRILSWSLLPFLLTLKFSVELVSAGQEQRALLAVSLATLATALLMAGLRARSGLVGVAWAVVLGELFQAWLLLRLGRGVGPGA